jgi:hypothetical protein
MYHVIPLLFIMVCKVEKYGLTYTSFTCITKRWPAMPLPCSASNASVANRTPLPVAASLPSDPPRSYIEHVCKVTRRENQYSLKNCIYCFSVLSITTLLQSNHRTVIDQISISYGYTYVILQYYQ